jgi:hypothetical protein
MMYMYQPQEFFFRGRFREIYIFQKVNILLEKLIEAAFENLMVQVQ